MTHCPLPLPLRRFFHLKLWVSLVAAPALPGLALPGKIFLAGVGEQIRLARFSKEILACAGPEAARQANQTRLLLRFLCGQGKARLAGRTKLTFSFPSPNPPPNPRTPRRRRGRVEHAAMKVSIKTLKGSSFEIEVDPSSKVSDVKKLIETTQGQNVYPADQQMLIHQGNVLKNETTLEENKVLENNFIVIMLSKKGSSSAASATAKAPTSQTPVDRVIPASPAIQPPLAAPAPVAPVNAPAPTATTAPSLISAGFTEAGSYGQAVSNLVAGGNLEATIQSILEMGGGAWDRGTVVRALQAAYNNPERAVEYLYSEEVPAAAAAASAPASGRPAVPLQVPQSAQSTTPSSGPNANPLDLFPQALPNASSNAGGGNLDVLRNNTQFRGLLSLVQANPQILQPLLQELGKQNPQIMELIRDNQDEFLHLISEPRLINEPAEVAERSLLDQFAGAGLSQTIRVTEEENEAIQRLVQMGFDRNLVLEVFFACNKDEQMAANYLLDHMNEFNDDAQQ